MGSSLNDIKKFKQTSITTFYSKQSEISEKIDTKFSTPEFGEATSSCNIKEKLLGFDLKRLSDVSVGKQFSKQPRAITVNFSILNTTIISDDEQTERAQFKNEVFINFDELRKNLINDKPENLTKPSTILTTLKKNMPTCLNNDSSSSKFSINSSINKTQADFDSQPQEKVNIMSTNQAHKLCNRNQIPNQKSESNLYELCFSRKNQKFISLKGDSITSKLISCSSKDRKQLHNKWAYKTPVKNNDVSCCIEENSESIKPESVEEHASEAENLRPIEYSESSKIKHLIMRKLLRIPCLTAVAEQSILEFLFSHARPFWTKQNNVIYSFGGSPKYVYLLLKGKVFIKYNNAEKYYSPFETEYFGEVEIVCKHPRISEMYANSDCYFFCIEKTSFLESLKMCYSKNNSIYLDLVDITPIQRASYKKATQKSLVQLTSPDTLNSIGLDLPGSSIDLGFSNSKVSTHSYCYIDLDILQSSCSLYKILPDSKEKKSFLDNLIPEVYDSGEIIIHQGEASCSIFIVAKGSASSYSEFKQLIRTYSKGDIFGFSDLLNAEFVHSEVVASILTTVYRVPYFYFKKHIRNYQNFIINSILYSSRFYSDISELVINNYSKLTHLKKGQALPFSIIEKDTYYFLIDGAFQHGDLSKIMKRKSQYKNEFDLKLLRSNNIESDLIAETSVLLLALQKPFKMFDAGEEKEEYKTILEILKQNSYFSFLSESLLIELSNLFHHRSYSESSTLYNIASQDFIYYITEGTVAVTKALGNSRFCPLNKSESFRKKRGKLTEESHKFKAEKESSLSSLIDLRNAITPNYSKDSINSLFSKCSSQGTFLGLNPIVYGTKEIAKCVTQVKCYAIKTKDFISFFPRTRYIWNYFIGNYIIQEEAKKLTLEEASMKIETNKKHNNLMTIESGGFLYHLKFFNNNNSKTDHSTYKTLALFSSLGLISPFNLHVLQQIERNEYSFFLINYLQSVPLSDFAASGITIDEQTVAFWILNMCFAIQWLHENRIIHRDIKPENFSINMKGYLSINDYSYSTFVVKEQNSILSVGDEGLIAKKKSALKSAFTSSHENNSDSNIIVKDKSKTILGSPHYMSPELIQNKESYGTSVDYWSLGVTIYELICGAFPFSQSIDDPYDVYKKILKGSLDFPVKVKLEFPLVKDLICKLLKKDLSLRLTCADLLFKHDLFVCIKEGVENVRNLKAKAKKCPCLEYSKLKNGSLLLNYFDSKSISSLNSGQ